jgi:hypothetical protein
MDEAQARVSSARQISKPVTVSPGEEVDLAVQFLDAERDGVNGVESLFVLSDPDALSFNDAPESSWAHIQSRRAVAGNVEADGLAITRVTAKPVSAPADVIVWAGLASSESLANDADPSASQPVRFMLHIVHDAADAGVQDATSAVEEEP